MPRGDIHRINIIAVNKRVELCGRWRSFISSRWEQGHFLAFVELLQVQNGLGVQTHTGQGLEQVTVTRIINIAVDLKTKTQCCDRPLPRLASTFNGINLLNLMGHYINVYTLYRGKTIKAKVTDC